MGLKGDPGIQGGNGSPGPRGPQGEKGEKGEKGKSISPPLLIEQRVKKIVNEGQTAVLKCVADGYPHSQVTWSRKASSLPVGRYIRRQRGRVVSASDSQSGGPGFESHSGHLLDLCSAVPSSNSRPRL